MKRTSHLLAVLAAFSLLFAACGPAAEQPPATAAPATIPPPPATLAPEAAAIPTVRASGGDAGEPGEAPPRVEPRTPAYEAGEWVATGGPPGGLGYDIRMDPRNPDVMYVTDAWSGAFKSTDGGATWFPINEGITTRTGPSGDAIPVFSLTVDPNNPDRLWAGTQFSSGAYRSDDGGESWHPMSNGIREESLSIRGFTVEPGNSDVVYLAGEVSSWEWAGAPVSVLGLDATRGVVYKTVDGGENWVRIWAGDNLARYVWISPQDHDLLYASTGIFDRAAANSSPAQACLHDLQPDGCAFDPEGAEGGAALDPGGVGILRSRDGGATWEVLGSANGFRPDELYFGSLFMHPENPAILLAAAGNGVFPPSPGHPLGAIYLTEDGGDNWARVLELHNASAVEVCSCDPNVMYAGSIDGVYRSMDGGHTWTELAGMLWGTDDVLAGFPIDMQCDPRDPMRVFINNYIGGNFLSEDGGVTWTVASKGYTGALLRQVAIPLAEPARVYSAGRLGVFASRDGGASWQGTAHHPARAPEAIVVSVDPVNADHVMAVLLDAGPDPKVSRDGGQSWSVVDTGLWAPGVWDSGTTTRIVFSPYDPNLVLASAGAADCHLVPGGCEGQRGYGIIRSTDGGETWSRTSLSEAQVLAIHFVNEWLVYAAAYPGTLYRSEDGGQSWQIVAEEIGTQIPRPGPELEPTTPVLAAIATDALDPNKLYAGFSFGALAISQDGGKTWHGSSSGLVPETSVVDIEVDRAHPGTVYLGCMDGGVFYSNDGGETWKSLNAGLRTRAIVDLALSAGGGVLYAATNGGGVFRLGTP